MTTFLAVLIIGIVTVSGVGIGIGSTYFVCRNCICISTTEITRPVVSRPNNFHKTVLHKDMSEYSNNIKELKKIESFLGKNKEWIHLFKDTPMVKKRSDAIMTRAHDLHAKIRYFELYSVPNATN